jgi:hypothetical protein
MIFPGKGVERYATQIVRQVQKEYCGCFYNPDGKRRYPE